jgi:hypothetical protein
MGPMVPPDGRNWQLICPHWVVNFTEPSPQVNVPWNRLKKLARDKHSSFYSHSDGEIKF